MKRTIILLITLSLITPNFTSAHSGGTDGNGCHAGTQPYHCHTSKSDNINWEAMAVGIFVLWGLNYLTRSLTDEKQYLNESSDDVSRRFYFLPSTDIDEDLNPSIGLKLGIDF